MSARILAFIWVLVYVHNMSDNHDQDQFGYVEGGGSGNGSEVTEETAPEVLTPSPHINRVEGMLNQTKETLHGMPPLNDYEGDDEDLRRDFGVVRDEEEMPKQNTELEESLLESIESAEQKNDDPERMARILIKEDAVSSHNTMPKTVNLVALFCSGQEVSSPYLLEVMRYMVIVYMKKTIRHCEGYSDGAEIETIAKGMAHRGDANLKGLLHCYDALLSRGLPEKALQNPWTARLIQLMELITLHAEPLYPGEEKKQYTALEGKLWEEKNALYAKMLPNIKHHDKSRVLDYFAHKHHGHPNKKEEDQKLALELAPLHVFFYEASKRAPHDTELTWKAEALFLARYTLNPTWSAWVSRSPYTLRSTTPLPEEPATGAEYYPGDPLADVEHATDDNVKDRLNFLLQEFIKKPDIAIIPVRERMAIAKWKSDVAKKLLKDMMSELLSQDSSVAARTLTFFAEYIGGAINFGPDFNELRVQFSKKILKQVKSASELTGDYLMIAKLISGSSDWKHDEHYHFNALRGINKAHELKKMIVLGLADKQPANQIRYLVVATNEKGLRNAYYYDVPKAEKDFPEDQRGAEYDSLKAKWQEELEKDNLAAMRLADMKILGQEGVWYVVHKNDVERTATLVRYVDKGSRTVAMQRNVPYDNIKRLSVQKKGKAA